MSKLVKAVVGTVIRLNCPECAEVFDLYWDIGEDIVDAAKGEVIPWVCARCQKNKKSKTNDAVEEGPPTSDGQRNICRLAISADKYSRSGEEETKTNIDDEINKSEVIYTSEELKSDISEIKANILDIKQELEQLR